MVVKRGWFGPKRFGWGASPASWQGWAATGVFILAMLLTGNLLRDVAWVWALMLAEVAIFLAVVILTFDKNARTHV
ncbi:hypothetical protein [Brevundimonas sp. NIBR11]|uniref:hypothetical protein n=1 Tax=Brevundimonas sp. NIBR11 TaxID=3015999 RepID=UPI0022F061C3|nr:hypothetical protein [Brevundimonas sp. NIBR11]WGM30290.1 hypothetical protein KKHFBJBL_00506 [Brevundimonas sp. NIBR11]